MQSAIGHGVRGFRVPTTSRFSSNGLVLSETLHEGGASHADHAHESAYFDMVLAGAHVEQFAGGCFELVRSHLAYRPAGSRHRNRVSTAGARCFNIELGREWLIRHDVTSLLPAGPRTFEDHRLKHSMWRLARELRSPDPWSSLAVDGIAIELVAHSARCRTGTRPPHWLATVRELLHQPTGIPPTLADLGRAAGVHPSHVARVVRRHFGCSVGEVLRSHRLAAAVERIKATTVPLSVIALDCGFCDQAHLTRVMRRMMGVTPGRLRRETIGAARPRTAATSKTGPEASPILPE